jgi:demethylmenaquinone methyltransferase/2-methoxy-6-polyprenyl-1,4-benzoquinol methylase
MEDPRERARCIQGMFSAIAPTYDLLNRLLSFGIDVRWRRGLADGVPRTAVRVLDLACGTGDVTREVVRARPSCDVFAADFTYSMLRTARPKLAQKGRDRHVHFQCASAEALPYRDRSFDAVTMAFGIRNVVHREVALAEIRRVLRPGGAALPLDFSVPPNALVRTAYGFYFHRLLPLLGGLVSGNFEAYRYLPRSVEGFPRREVFARLMEEQGLIRVTRRDLTLGVATLYRGERAEDS